MRPGGGGGAAPACHQLVTTGTKIWGIGPLLPIARLYDFAVYLDAAQARASGLARQFAPQLSTAPAALPRQQGFYMALRHAHADVDFSLVREILEGEEAGRPPQRLGRGWTDGQACNMAASSRRRPALHAAGALVRRGPEPPGWCSPRSAVQ